MAEMWSFVRVVLGTTATAATLLGTFSERHRSLMRRAAPLQNVYLSRAPPPVTCVRQIQLHGRTVELRARHLGDRLARRSSWELRRWKSRESVAEIPCCLDVPRHQHHLVWPEAWAGAQNPVSSARQGSQTRLSRSWRCTGAFSVLGTRAATPTAQRAAPHGARSGSRLTARRCQRMGAQLCAKAQGPILSLSSWRGV